MKMKRIFALILTLVMMCSTVGCFAAENDAVLISEETSAVGEITLQIGNPMMTVSGKEQEIYPGENAVPVIIDNRTLVPIRAIIEANANVIENGFTVSRDKAADAKEDVINWLKELGYIKE